MAWIDSKRVSLIIGRERHYYSARPGNLPYPMRAVRTPDHLYIKNFKPERWPMGNPYDAAELTDSHALYEMGLSTMPAYRDLDGSLTKAWMMSQRGSPHNKELFSLTMNPRPSEELYDLNNDPDQLTNLAADPQHASALKTLRGQVVKVMNDTNDARLTDAFDQLPWVDSTKP